MRKTATESTAEATSDVRSTSDPVRPNGTRLNPTIAEIREPVIDARTATTNDDSRLKDRVQCALSRTGYHTLREVTVQVCRGSVCLHGLVPSWYLKQVAQEHAMSVDGVERLTNDIQVVPHIEPAAAPDHET